MRWKVVGVVLAVAVCALLAWTLRASGAETVSWRTAKVTRQDLVTSIPATGTVEPEEVVDVGAQVAGMVLSFGTDRNGKTIDYGSQVDEGTVLANIDSSLYEADAAQARAQVAAAKAAVVRSEADLGQLQAKLVQADADWKRAQQLGPTELAPTAVDAAKAAFDVSGANVKVGEAEIEQARANLALAEAAALRAEHNLQYCVIRSPVQGVIVDRRVNIGQTVVSSLNAPSLFLIAKDLKRVQVWAAVNEVDISRVHAGQTATFTVDAHPGKTFEGTVIKVRLNASMTQNVVTYTVEVRADNEDGLLLPYLTANVAFVVSRHEQVLAAPNTALHWNPAQERIDPEAPAATPPAEGSATLWVPAGSRVRPIAVRTGATDGTVTEVEGPDLREDLEIVTGEVTSGGSAPPSSGSNPFTPQMTRGRRST